MLISALVVMMTNCARKDPLTIEDYQRAEKFLGANTTPLVLNAVSSPQWLDNGKLVYKKSVQGGHEYMIADPGASVLQPAFDHSSTAAQLSRLTGETIDPLTLNLVDFQAQGETLFFNYKSKAFVMNLADGQISNGSIAASDKEFLSPNGLWAAYIKSDNLWVRNTKTNKHIQLTFDGQPEYGYGTNNAGWIQDEKPVLLWSPASDKIATFRQDSRGVKEMYLYNTQVGHVKLKAWKYPLPGDSLIFRVHRVIIHITPSPRLVRLDIPADPQRSTITDHIAGRDGELLDAEWSEDGSVLAFVSSSRDHQIAQLRIADASTGAVRDVLREEVVTYFESGKNKVNWHLLKESNEVVWFSERDNWGHLYLYDLTTGTLKNQITKGNWAVLQVLRIDNANRQIYFTGSNREEGDPYYEYFYRINFDGSDLTNLTPESAHHSITLANDGRYFVDSYSTPTTPPVSVIRDQSGKVVMELEKADASMLLAAGWVPPVPFTAKARDGETDLYGLMYKPSNFNPDKQYPILNYLYPGPQTGSVGSRAFSPSRADKQAIAELGFVVVEVDAMGTPGRSKSFHDAYYGNMGDNGLPDQVTVIQQLAAQNPWMDINRVGIWGHSGGGFASTGGILRYPDFYKVAVSSAGNHDNRNYEDDWGEKWHGLLVPDPSDTTRIEREVGKSKGDNYDRQANQLLAGNLKGKLLIAHGMMDDNVHPSNTLLVVDALIAADKDFDMVVIPNARHGFSQSRFFMKKRWDYFVKHLKGEEPPADFVFQPNIK